MQLPPFEYIRPASLAEGLQLLADRPGDVAVMAGGTDLLLNMKFRLESPKYLLSLNGLTEMQQVEEQPDGSLRIGAGCKLTDLANNRLIRDRYPALHAAIESVGSLHVRNMATIGGNICLETRCWYTNQSETWRETREGCFKTDNQLCHVIKTASKCHALSSTDTGPVLMAMDAVAVVVSADGERRVPMVDFYRDDGIEHTVLKPGEVLAAIVVPPPNGHTVFAKLAQREGLDFAAGTFAAAMTGSSEAPESVRLVMGSIAPEPRLMEDGARILLSEGFTDEAIETVAGAARSALSEVTNLFTPSGYKRRLIRALIKDALLQLRDQAENNNA